jgi:uncharacterized protein
MAKFLNNWILGLGLAALICAGCKQSNPKTPAEHVADFSQMNFAEVKAAADKGSPAAQFESGERFYYGRGVLKDSTEAVEWWQKAAAQKFPPAEYELGVAYGRGDGVAKDAEQGIKWCRMAADAGLPVAQEFIGALYAMPHSSLQQNYAQAFKWFRASADQGYPHAEYFLALCYRDGKGTETNIDESILWLQRAASNGLANAQFVLGKYYGDNAFAALQAKLRNVKNKPDGEIIFGENIEQNFKQAVKWLGKAANQNYPDGQFDLCIFCAVGYGTDKDQIEACKWFVLANAKGQKFGKTFVEMLKTNKITFTSEQMSEGEQKAKEFTKTNHIAPFLLLEIPGL